MTGLPTKRVRWAAIAVAGPGCVLAAATVAGLVMATFGVHPMWPETTVNLAEAAASRDHGEVGWLLELGEDPNVVRDAPLVGDGVRVTPLEAAVLQNDEDLVEMLFALGATVDATSWVRLRCLSRGDAVSAVLASHKPDGAEINCQGIVPSF